MRITILGANGNMGRRIINEAINRGHDVTAVIRHGSEAPLMELPVKYVHGDATDAEEIKRLCCNCDVLVTATRPQTGHEHELVKTTALLLKTLAFSSIRLLISGGAASLKIPDRDNRLLLDDERYMPRSVLPIGRACLQQYELCLANDSVDWTYVSPSALLVAGERSMKFRIGGDELLTDSSGRSHISMEDLAVALLDEIETPRHIRRRFTVGY
jgi:putative NADH-flavin reductase